MNEKEKFEAYKRYRRKQSLTGNRQLEFLEDSTHNIIDEDIILVSKYNNINGINTVEIPKFVDGVLSYLFESIKEDLKVVYKGGDLAGTFAMFALYQGKHLDLTEFNLECIHDFSNFFQDCKNLENIKWGKYKAKQVKIGKDIGKVKHMFSGCRNLKQLDLTPFELANLGKGFIDELFEDFEVKDSLDIIVNKGDIDILHNCLNLKTKYNILEK